MANMFNMMKQAASMKKQMKQMQKELKKRVINASQDGITVSVRGDMSVTAVKIDPDEAPVSDLEKLGKAVSDAANKALDSAKKEAEAEMSKLAGGLGLGGLSDMLGL